MKQVRRNGVSLQDFTPTLYSPHKRRSSNIYGDGDNPSYKPAIRNGLRDGDIITENLVLNLPLYLFNSAKFKSVDTYKTTCTVTTSAWGIQGYTFAPNGKIDCTDLALTDAVTALSVEAWVNVTTWTANMGVVTKRVAGSDSWGLLLNTNETFGLKVYTEAGNAQANSADTSRTTGVWYHVVGTWDATNIQMYVNGAASGSAAALGGTITDSGISVMLGRYYDTANDLAGVIGEVRIYNQTLSAGEVARNYNTTKWRFA